MSIFFTLAVSWAVTASAHGTRPAVADVVITETQVELEIYASFEQFLAGIDMQGLADTDDAPQADEYNRLRALSDAEFANVLRNSWPRLRDTLRITGVGPLALDTVVVDPEPDLEFPRDTRIFISAPRTADDITFGWAAENGPIVLRHGSGESASATLLEGGDTSPTIGQPESAAQVAWRFVVSGFDHIIPKGLDHILFVLGLYLFALAWRPLLAQVTAFTLAHTVTLGLATVQIITIPDSQMWLVETLIALSISYVAIENIFRPQLGWWRIVVVFGFGLLHGLGFASVLGDFGLAQGQFILSLVAFNIGVEIGQLAVILVAFVALGLTLGRTAYYRTVVVIPGSLCIAAVGLYWVVERAIL